MASLHSAHCPGCLARSHPLETSCLFPSHALRSLKILCSTLLTTTCLQMYQQLWPLKNGLGSLVGLRIPGTASSPVSQVLKQFSAHLLAWTLLTSPLKSSLKKKKISVSSALACNSKFHFKSPNNVFTPAVGETIYVEPVLLARPGSGRISSALISQQIEKGKIH